MHSLRVFRVECIVSTERLGPQDWRANLYGPDGKVIEYAIGSSEYRALDALFVAAADKCASGMLLQAAAAVEETR